MKKLSDFPLMFICLLLSISPPGITFCMFVAPKFAIVFNLVLFTFQNMSHRGMIQCPACQMNSVVAMAYVYHGITVVIMCQTVLMGVMKEVVPDVSMHQFSNSFIIVIIFHLYSFSIFHSSIIICRVSLGRLISN